MLVLVAVGGNALIRPGESGKAEEQFANAMQMADTVVGLLKAGHRVVLTHGNGPQIGAMLTRSETAATDVYRLPYDCCVAATQGEIGYVFQYALWQTLQRERMTTPVVTLVTQVRVDPEDPAFHHPTKPIGPFYRKEAAEQYTQQFGWTFELFPGKGYRRVVPSPDPKEIIEIEAIRACTERGMLVIAGGGGGVPVFNDHDIRKGVEAVIDKDLTSSLLAAGLGADVFAIATGVECVCLDYGTPGQRALTHLTDVECRGYLAAGQFPEGSMGPKIEAALRYLERGGRRVVITDLEHLTAGIEGKAGTSIEVSDELVEWP